MPRHIVAIACVVFLSVAGATQIKAQEVSDHRDQWFATSLDHRDSAFRVLVHRSVTDVVHLRVLDLHELGIRFETEIQVRHAGEVYVPTDALIDHEAHLDALMVRVHFVSRVRPHHPDAPRDLLLDIRVNGVLVPEPQYVVNTGSDLVLPRATLEQLRIVLPDAFGPFVDDELPIHALAGENFYLALDELYLEMSVAPERFATTRLSRSGTRPQGALTAWAPALVAGYHVSGGDSTAGDDWNAALADLSFSAGTMSCHSRHLHQSWTAGTRRLESACIVDRPARALSAGIGDHHSAAGSLQHPVAYGGAWIGTDYALQPYRNLQPSLVVDGVARLPSTLEIWMDRQTGLRHELPPGPFVIDHLPAVSGRGELQAVLVDALGQQVIVSGPVYSDPRLLHPGTVDWRIDTGRLRTGGGQMGYTERFGSADLRVGVTNWLTLDAHAERSDVLDNASVGAAARLGALGVLETSVARSELAGVGSGHALVVGYSWRGSILHAAYRETRRTHAYVNLGAPAPGLAPSLERIATIGFTAGGTSWSATGIERAFDASGRRHALAVLSMARRVGRFGRLQATAVRNLSTDVAETEYALQWSMPLGARGHAHHSMTGTGGVDRLSTGFSVSPPAGTGAGGRASRDVVHGQESYGLDGTYRGGRATGGIAAQHDREGESAWSGRLSGAFVATPAGAGLTRDDGGAFAIVRTGPAGHGIMVQREHQDALTTGRGGTAIVSGLRPYEDNRLGLDPTTLPLSATVDADRLAVVPGRRGVAVAEFGYLEQRHVIARLEPAASIGPIPVGAHVTVNGRPAGLVGFDGRIYAALENDLRVRLRAEWGSTICEAIIAVPRAASLHDAGVVRCE